jgi:ubiquinone/menaquinone biosynthesis C-methylase UbiE
MNKDQIRQLDDQAIQQFDQEYVDDFRWQIIQSLIDKTFTKQNFSFLDIGGGNGRFTDRILQAYPQSTGTLLDNSESILALNKIDRRKRLILGSVEDLTNIFGSSNKYISKGTARGVTTIP